MTRLASELRSEGLGGWRWYHFYFVLALVDLLVIVASLWLIRQTIDSYEVALQKMSSAHARQRWIAQLRLLVVQLNAPGNDVFESQRVPEERDRFENCLQSLLAEVQLHRSYDLDLTEFQSHLQRMVDEERHIFRLLGSSEDVPTSASDRLLEASRRMAAMDRYQSAAVTALTELEQKQLMRVASLLAEHGARIHGHVAIERVFVGLIGVILIGMFWYGRKLQQLHNQMNEDQLRAATERVRRLAAVGEVCAAVSHGIRNPLATISSSAQLGLMSPDCSQATRGRLEDILTECGRLDRRVTQLLNFASQASTQREPFALRSVVEQAAAELRPRFEERRIRLDVSFSECPTIDGDRERMVQCVIELLSNALDHSPACSVVTVQCAACLERQGFVDLLVSDDGPGVPPQIAERVFDLFFTTRPGGTGIGLASVKHTVHSHGGEVMIVPSIARGTQVRITLPCLDPTRASRGAHWEI